MAELTVDGGDLVVALSAVEKFWSFHGDLRVPLSAIRRVRIPSAVVWLQLRGWRATGVCIPGYVAMGKRRHSGGYDFSLLVKQRPSVIIELNGAEFGEVAVSVDDNIAVGEMISAAAGILFDPAPDADPPGVGPPGVSPPA